MLKLLRIVLLSLLFSLLFGLVVGTVIRMRLERPIEYIGATGEDRGGGVTRCRMQLSRSSEGLDLPVG